MRTLTQYNMQSVSPYYESVEFNLSTGQSDYNLASNQANFLSVFNTDTHKTPNKFPSRMMIRTNETISVKVNSSSNHSITITSVDSPFVLENIEVSNLFLSNSSGNTAAVKLLFTNTI